MPGFGGLDAQPWLNMCGIRIPSVIITGRDDDEVRARSRAVGASACLCKPIDADVLFETIARAVARENAHQLAESEASAPIAATGVDDRTPLMQRL